MTPPIRFRPVPSHESLELDFRSPIDGGARTSFPATGFVPPFRVPGILSRFRLPTLFLAEPPLQIPSAPSATEADASPPLRFIDFLPALFSLAEGIESMDLDLYQVPVNRSSGLCRYSEFTPRDTRPAPEDCSLTVYPNTRARVHGEIRPIRGREESLITRFLVDFSPNVFNAAPLNPLEIDGFGGVDAPDMSYDRSFSDRTPVLSLSGGDVTYENPFATHAALATPFGQEAEPPPHRDFMIRFAPVESTVLSAVQRSAGESRLMLWAFLPTLGISQPAMFEELGIRFNTLPRRFGDLLRIFSPLFDRARGSALRESAPYLNPNNEVLLDPEELRELNAEREARGESPLTGLRQALPLDRAENVRWHERRERLNARRVERGLPRLPTITSNRGPVIDWAFTDLARDPARLAALSDSELPHLTVRARLRATRIALPMGELTLQAGAEVRLRYSLERVENPPPGHSPVRLAIQLRIEPADIAGLALEAGETRTTADRLQARSVELQWRSPILLDPRASSPGSDFELRLNGVQAENLGFSASELGFLARLGSARLQSFTFSRSPRTGFRAELTGLEASAGHLEHSSLELNLGRISVPSFRLEREIEAGGEQGPLRILVPDLGIESIEGGGRTPIRSGSFRLQNGEIELQSGRAVFSGDLDLQGSFPGGLTEGPLHLGNFTIHPAIEDLRVQGRARFELQPESWSLRRAEGAAPLRIGFRIGPSWLSHSPELPEPLRSLAASRVVESRVEIASAEVQVEDLREVEFELGGASTGRGGRIRELHSGPISIHHVRGGGRLWVGLPIWGWVRGFFPDLGGPSTSRASHRPDFSPLVRHLSPDAQALLEGGDFLRIGGVNLHREPSGAWRTDLEDLIFSLQEAGGRHQFGGLRIPRFSLESRASAEGEARTLFELDPNYWANIYLNDPDRGGSFRFIRWPERP